MFKVKDEEIQKLIDIELDNAKQYGEYHSTHEFYAIVDEEFDESYENMISVKNNMQYIWEDIKNDVLDEQRIETLKKASINTIKELLQVCACCDKYLSVFKK